MGSQNSYCMEAYKHFLICIWILKNVTYSFLPFIFVLPAMYLIGNIWWYIYSTFSVHTSQKTNVHRIQWLITVFRNQTQNVNTPKNKPVAEHDPLTVPSTVQLLPYSNKPYVITLPLLDLPHQLRTIINQGVGILHYRVNATFSQLNTHTHNN